MMEAPAATHNEEKGRSPTHAFNNKSCEYCVRFECVCVCVPIGPACVCVCLRMLATTNMQTQPMTILGCAIPQIEARSSSPNKGPVRGDNFFRRLFAWTTHLTSNIRESLFVLVYLRKERKVPRSPCVLVGLCNCTALEATEEFFCERHILVCNIYSEASLFDGSPPQQHAQH